MTIAAIGRQPAIIIGVDAHKHTHHAVALTSTGKRLADCEFPVTTRGYADLLAWANDHGQIVAFGVESTGSYAAGLARFLTDHGVEVREVNTPHAHTKARVGKDDVIDAEAAARKVLAGEATAVPKRTDSVIESIRFLMVARDSAVKARTAAIVQLQDVLITAPAQIREQVRSGGRAAVTHCRKFRIDRSRLDDPAQAVKLALRTLAMRVADLDTEIIDLERSLAALVQATAPPSSARSGSARSMLPSSWSRPGRTLTDSIARPRSRDSAEPHQCRSRQGKATGCDSIEAATGKPTARST